MKKSEIIFLITHKLKTEIPQLVNSTVDWDRGQLKAQNFKQTNFVQPPACLVSLGEIDWEKTSSSTLFQSGEGEITITIIQENYLESREAPGLLSASAEQTMLTPKMDFTEQIKEVLTGFSNTAPGLRYKFSPLILARDHETEFRNDNDQNLIIDCVVFSTKFTRKNIC